MTAGEKNFAKTKIQRGIFQGDALSSLLFIIAMMPLNHILRKYTARYKLSKSQEKTNHLMYIDDIKLFAKTEKELETLIHAVRIYSQDIGMKCAMLIMKSDKRHLTEGMELPNQDKECSEKRKPTNTRGYWKLIPLIKRRWKKKINKDYLRRMRMLLETKL